MPTIYGMAPFTATEAILQYRLVKMVGVSGIEYLDGAVPTDFAWGISQTAALLGEAVDVETRPGRQSRCVAGAAFAAGVRLKAGSGVDMGKVVPHTVGALCVAIAMETATAIDQIVKVRTVFNTVAGP